MSTRNHLPATVLVARSRSAGWRGISRGWCCLLWLVLIGPLQAANAPTGLLCDLLEHPELTVISTATPQFGWIYNPSLRNDFQTGYRIIVSSSQVLASQGTGDLWDSGLVGSSASINVPYAGTTLAANTDYYWRVQTMDSAGQTSLLSAVQHFHTDTRFNTGSNLIYNSSTNVWANRYPLSFVSVAPRLITNTAPGRWFIDFGQDAFGYVTLHLNGSSGGANMQARFGEMASGMAVNATPPSGSTVRYATSTVSLQNGDVVYSIRPPTYSGQTISPPASYGVVMPFRYFELTNCPGTLTAADVTQQQLLYQFNTNAAAFNSSSAALNQVWNLCRNSMQALSFDGVYVDGDRERKPYEADSYIHQLSSYAVDREFTMVRYSFEYLLTHPTWPTEWKFHMIFIAYADYLQTGDTNLLKAHYTALQPDSFTWAAVGNGLMKGFPNFPQTTNSDIVDWPAGDRDGFLISNGSYLNWTNSVNNAFYYRALQTMANIATAIGRTNDAATYSNSAAQVYTAYNSTFWNNGSQNYIDGVGTGHSAAHANFFPLAFGLVPPANQPTVLNYLHGRIAAVGGMPPSVYGAQYLLDALFQQSDADVALGLMTTNGPRGWMSMINLGSTITTEAWNFTDKPNMDWNHAWGAAAGNLIERFVLGVRPITAGYGQFLIQPQLGQTLSSVQGIVPTIRGPVSIQASNAPGLFQLLVTVPGNSAATIMLPALGATAPVALLDGSIAPAVLSNNWLTLTNVGSGQHAIWLATNSSPSVDTLYSNWAASWFGTNAANPAIAGMAADPDGDGQSNYSEFIAGADPKNPQSSFHIDSVASSKPLTIALSGVAGRNYILQRTLNLSTAAWVPVATNLTLAAGQVVLADPQTPAPGAFYRVAVSLP